ncbi:hypothetical protein CASFOL_008906 [Castilleja foliolosa]|uniref:Peptidase A1 domain-containing protein n=1 Tax=Castilleja foliolosa TaxID=1961234 RepID=A0ABD3E0A8_9LAMI
MARETFMFASSDGDNKIEVKDIVFGCGIRNTGFTESAEDNLVAGNFGLGPGDNSFLRQKLSLTKGRFSYCFLPWDVAHKSPVFLRFGSDIPKRKDLKSTPLLTKPGVSDHFVNLLGISVGNTRLNIPQKMFGQSSKRNSGCIVDSGSYMTRLPRTVYNKLTQTLMTNHFSGNEPTQIGQFGFCYFFPSGKDIKELPDITFHLQGSDLVFPPRQGFIDLDAGNGDSFFCLAMMPYDIEGERVIVIGGFQQANIRFVFDTVKQKLYFGPEDCSRDG